MHDRVINDVFDFPSVGRLRVVKEGAVKECYGCVFNSPEHCQNDPDRLTTGACAATERMDKTGVIFVKEKKGEDA